MVHHFFHTRPLQNVDFSKVGNMQDFFRNCTHILTRTQGKKFEDMFLVKIASKGTSLTQNLTKIINFPSTARFFPQVYQVSGFYLL